MYPRRRIWIAESY